MTYTPNTPQATDTIAFTQPLIQSNFNYIENAVERDHAWQGNIIGTEEPGRHQQVSFPNQGTDIAALPAGISSVAYAIGGNLFAYNGSKQPVSGITGTGSLTITTSFQNVLVLPANSIGMITFTDSNFLFGGSSTFLIFSMPIGGPGVPPYYPAWVSDRINGSAATTLVAIMSGNTLQIQRTNGVNFTSSYKYIYWPV